jgi:DNA topoisomerase-2
LYRPEDDQVVKYLNDDGQSIEPEWYLPIIPMVLVNGGEGIGTGWSTFIPNYNPSEVSLNIRNLLDGKAVTKMHPWYKGFKGSIEVIGEDKYRITGLWRVVDDCTLEINELPVGTWTQSYKEYLESLLNGDDKSQPFIKEYREYHTETFVRFIVTLPAENMGVLLDNDGIEKKFKLSTTITTSNLVCFDANGRIKRFASPEKIIEDFYDVRLEYYQKRKDGLTEQLNQEWSRLDNRCRFITEIVNGTLTVHKRKKVDIVSDLRKRGYSTFKNELEVNEGENGDDAVTGSVTDYDYLLSMPIYSLTMERVNLLNAEKEAKEAELNALLKKTAKDLWREDLDAFEEKWNEHHSTLNVQSSGPSSVKKAPGARKQQANSTTSTTVATTKKPAAKKTKVTEAAPPKPAATLSSNSTKTQSTLDMFSKPITQIENFDDLPLAERISKMLAARMNQSTTTTATTSAPNVKVVAPPVVPPKKIQQFAAKDAAAKPKAIRAKRPAKSTLTISSSEGEEEESYVVEDEDESEYSE